MVKQNEKTIMKSADICPGQVWHKVFNQRVWLPQHLQIILILVLCAGVVLSTNTTDAPSASLPTAQSGVIYFIEVTVDGNGTNITEQDICNWLQPVFQNNLQTCRSPVHTTSAPKFSTGPFITSTNVSSTSEINVTDSGTTSRTTIEATAITVIINNPAASTSNPNASQSTTSSTANSTATTLVTSTIPTTTTTSTISSSVTTLTTKTAAGTSPTFTPTTNTNLQSSAPQSTKEKPSNTPNPNSEKLIRVAREISVEGTGIFKDFEASCVNTTSISETNCFITLTLKEKVNPCCILQTLCEASKMSTNITVTGKKVERAGILQPNATECSDPFEDVCVYKGPSGPTCAESGTEFSISSSNLTQCENKCNCSAYCSGTDAYYMFKITKENLQLVESAITTLLYSLSSVPECTSNLSCATFDLAPKYKSSSFTCTKNLYCTVVVVFSEEIPICALSDLIALLLNSLSINMIGLVTRAAICGNAIGDVGLLLKSPHRLVNVNLNSDQFCPVTEEIKLLNCQPEETIVAIMNEQCVLAPTTTNPNMTTSLQSNTTVSANETTTATTNISSTSANETTTATTNTSSTSANETTTATTNTSTTSANETSTIATTTAGGSLATAYELLEMSKNAAQLNSSQVDQLVSTLENILSGPTVSMELGNISVEIVSNLQSASAEAVDNSKNRIMGIVDTVGLKLVLTDTTESILSAAVALSVQQADGTNFQGASFSISDPNTVQNGIPRARRAAREISSVPQGSITLPSSLTQNLTAEQQQMVSRVQFNFYQKSTLFQDKSMGDRVLNSGILGASVANVTISDLQDYVILYLRNLQPVPANYVATCVFWDFTMNDRSGGWNSNGCFVQNTTDNETICACSHLTSFGILLDLSREPITSRTQANILTFITYIGCGISAVFVAVTLLTYLAFGKLRKDIPSKILIQLCFSLLFLNLVFLVDAWLALYPDAVGLCISTAWFLHYFLLVTFSWMGLEAVHMYIALVKVFNSHISHYMLRFSLAGWGIPMIVVIIVIAIDKDNYGLVSYGKFTDGTSDEFCWIRNDVAFYVAVVAYFCVIFLFNLVMFIVVLVQLRRLKRQNPHNLQHRTTLQDVRSVLGITILLGLSWGFAFFAWGPLNLPFMYLFAIFNSLQGFFIFIFHCAVKENVRRQWRTYLCCGRMRLAENSEWSRTATQKTMKKSSVTRITSLHSSKSNNSSNSSSYLVSDSSDQMNGFGSPFSDGMITADEDPRMDVILNELNSQYRRL